MNIKQNNEYNNKNFTISHKCNELLNDHKIAYEKYNQELIAYKQALQIYNQQKLKLQQENDPRNIAAETFTLSNFIEYQGLPYDCSQNHSTLSCTLGATDAHKKC